MKTASTVLVLAFAAMLVSGAAATGPAAPAITYQDDQFGAILATPKKQALYTWNVEKRAGGKVRCTGACAAAWPPLYARRAVPRRVAGIGGALGTIRRPDGKLQVTFNGLPVYTYAHEAPEQVLCDNVDGWFVVRLK